MIKFPCNCGHPFEFPDDMAGGFIQCPKCGRLNDVPTQDELKSLDADGLIRLGDDPVVPEPRRFAELHRAFSKEKIDESGDDIDLRQSLEEVNLIGSAPPLAPDEAPPRPAGPKYDPVTGELIRPIDVVDDGRDYPPPASIPMAQAALSYAPVNVNLDQEISFLAPLLRMFKLVNVVAMAFVFGAHVVIFGCMFIITFLLAVAVVVGWLPALLIGGLIAHYPNVIEDIGPLDKDELPRFMRDFSAHEDFFRPMFNCLIAVAYCYGPLLAIQAFVHIPSYAKMVLMVGYAVAGTLMFPGVFLTSVTSGAIVNLRPDRVWRTIGIIGIRYIYLLALFVIAAPLYLNGAVGTALSLVPYRYVRPPPVLWPLLRFPIPWFCLILGVVLMHYWCWCMGLVYRWRHEAFPWAWQRTIRDTSRFMGPMGKPRLPLPDVAPRARKRRMARPAQMDSPDKR